ncbi:hypothetical protein GCM10009665_54910 [Kitasatospora nipponensis]|uniref:N-acetyltransferase domain-containing protein n=1 Tax=Kitasatospora nipponensis TaxID=258049 RepID=A0ABN1WNQ6_9ACTN
MATEQADRTARQPVIRRITAPGAELDAIYEQILLPSFPPDELDDPADLDAAVRSGLTSVWAGFDPAGRPLGAAIGEFEPTRRIVLLAWLAVRPGLRGAGVGGLLLRSALRTWRQEYDPCLVLAEVADPRAHATHDGYGDPAARLAFYRRLGARTLDLPYFQPALGTGRARVDDVLLMALHAHPALAGPDPDTVDGDVLRGYLEDYQRSYEGAVGTDEQASRLWRALARPDGIPLLTGDTAPPADQPPPPRA